MTASDLKMLIAMLELIKKHASERQENETAGELSLVLDALQQKSKEGK